MSAKNSINFLLHRHEIDQKAANNRGFSSSIIEPHFNDEKKKTSERKDDREKKEQRGVSLNFLEGSVFVIVNLV